MIEVRRYGRGKQADQVQACLKPPGEAQPHTPPSTNDRLCTWRGQPNPSLRTGSRRPDPSDPRHLEQLGPLIAQKEAALELVAVLEQDYLRISQRLLALSSTLEVASVHALAALTPASTGISLGLERLVDEARTASEVAREVSSHSAPRKA